jgi:UDP:flavonoid glycosyltransferase YjiC (YdhE family)
MPLASALRDRGDEVLLAAGGGVSPDSVGIPVHDVAGALPFGRIAGRVMLAHPLLARRELAGRAGSQAVGRIFGAVNSRLLDAVVRLTASWRPDIVVYEPLAVAGAVAAARHDVPAVLLENTLFDGADLVAATAGTTHLRRAASRHGVERVPAPEVRLVTAPPSVIGHRPGRALRAVPYSGRGTAPGWLVTAGRRPRVVVSHSTVAGPGGSSHVRHVVDAAGDLDAEVVLVRPPAAIARRALPENVRTVGWVPLAAVLPHAAAVVHHGGAGTVLGALAAGIPQLVVPGGGDRRFNAERVAARGAGLAVEPTGITTGVLQSLLGQSGARVAAAEVREEMARMPDPAVTAEELAHLT